MLALLNPARLIVSSNSTYEVRLARSNDEIIAAQRLRYSVFNLELREGLAASEETGLDQDEFDTVCDHLVVRYQPTNEIVGTYRLQSGPSAAAHLGYYSEQEFDFRPYELLRHEMLELGRACVHQQHRNLTVLGLLWRGVANYARSVGARYLIGCSSITTQSPKLGASLYADLCRRHLAPPNLRTIPRPEFESPLDELDEESPKAPKLLRAYLSLGARICGPPALDAQFRTIDFLTLLDLEDLSPPARERFLC